jgi:hypothetical protein
MVQIEMMPRCSLALSTLLAVICGCGGDDVVPVCPEAVGLWSPCGFVSVTTTCTGGPGACESFANGTSCSIGPVTSDCTVTVVLGDGTTHDVSVTVAAASGCTVDVVTDPSQGFASPTCTTPDTDVDAASDAANDAQDASDAGG